MPNRGCTYFDRVGTDGAGTTLARFYAERHRHSPETVWRARAEAGEISRNGRTAGPDERLAAGDSLAWRRPPWDEPEVPTDWRAVFEDAHVLAVDKPAGLPCMPAGGFLEHTLARLVAAARPGENPVPVHRLGRGTSGLVLFAKTPVARRVLASLFRDGTARSGGVLEKRYLARTVPLPDARPGDRFAVEAPIGPVPHGHLGSVWAASPGGKPARSVCTVLETDGGSTLWDVKIATGRPHQIRIHLAWLGCPLAGDPLFLPGGVPRPDVLPGECGYFLRAAKLRFPHPATGEPLEIAVPAERPSAT